MSNPENAVSARNVLKALRMFGYVRPGAYTEDVWLTIKEALDAGDPFDDDDDVQTNQGDPTTEVASGEHTSETD